MNLRRLKRHEISRLGGILVIDAVVALHLGGVRPRKQLLRGKLRGHRVAVKLGSLIAIEFLTWRLNVFLVPVLVADIKYYEQYDDD